MNINEENNNYKRQNNDNYDDTEDFSVFSVSKFDDLFKLIFGNNQNKNITKRFLKDIIGIEIEESDQINFYNTETSTKNEFIENEKRPVVDINIEIIKNQFIQTSNNNQKVANDNNENNNYSIVKEEPSQFKQKIVVEMNVYRDSDVLTRCLYNACNGFCNLYSYDEFIKKRNLYSVNILYKNAFKSKKINEEKENEKKKEFFTFTQMQSPDKVDIVIPGVAMYFIELDKFDIKTVDENDAKELWAAFFKIIDYSYTKKGNKEYIEITNNMTDELYNKFKKIPEIVEAIEICKKTKIKKKIIHDYFYNLSVENAYLKAYIKQVKIETKMIE